MHDLGRIIPKQLFKDAVHHGIAEGRQHKKAGKVDTVQAWMTNMTSPNTPPAQYESCIANAGKGAGQRTMKRDRPSIMETDRTIGQGRGTLQPARSREKGRVKGKGTGHSPYKGQATVTSFQ